MKWQSGPTCCSDGRNDTCSPHRLGRLSSGDGIDCAQAGAGLRAPQLRLLWRRNPSSIRNEARLLQLHKSVLQYHVDNNLDAWMQDESESYTSANRGQIQHPTIEERRARLAPYESETAAA